MSQRKAGDELLVIGDRATAASREIASGLADTYVDLRDGQGRIAARAFGAQLAANSVLLFIDSDVVIPPHCLERFRQVFSESAEIIGAYARLAADSPCTSICGRYKNLYMHTVFEHLGENEPILYGSCHAIRAGHFIEVHSSHTGVEDNALGILFQQNNWPVRFIRDLCVEHLKEHTLLSLLKNDFQVARRWVPLLLAQHSYSSLPRRGFLHAPPQLLLAVIFCPLALFTIFLRPGFGAILILLWMFLNSKFISESIAHRKLLHPLVVLSLLFLSQLAYALGIAVGVLETISGRNTRQLRA